MASSANSDPYAFQRASTLATRSLVSDTKPTEMPSASSPDLDSHAKPNLQRKATNNYEEAAAEATRAGQMPATTAGSAAASIADRPGMQRQQSWKRSDLKGQLQSQMLAGVTSGQGYSSTQK